MALDDSLFKGRQIKVCLSLQNRITKFKLFNLNTLYSQVLSKRTNKPGISSTDRAPRGGYVPRGAGMFRGGRGGAMRGGGYNPYMGGFRGRAPR